MSLNDVEDLGEPFDNYYAAMVEYVRSEPTFACANVDHFFKFLLIKRFPSTIPIDTSNPVVASERYGDRHQSRYDDVTVKAMLDDDVGLYIITHAKLTVFFIVLWYARVYMLFQVKNESLAFIQWYEFVHDHCPHQYVG